LRRGGAACAGFASFGAEAVVGVAATLSGWLSVPVRALSPRSGSSFRAIRACSAFTGDICTTAAGGGGGLSIWPKK